MLERILGRFRDQTLVSPAPNRRTRRSRILGLEGLESRELLSAPPLPLLAPKAAAAQVFLFSSAPSIDVGQTVTFVAVVSPAAGARVPTGSVTFLEGLLPLGNVPVDAGGKAVLTTNLAAGTGAVTAVYSGDSVFGGTGSPPLVQSVNPDVTGLFIIRPLKSHHSGKHLAERFLLFNKASFAIPAPLVLVLEDFKHGAVLRNSSGWTQFLSPDPSPFVVVDSSPLAPEATVRVTLILHASRNHLTFTPRLIAGSFGL